jgi:hypothetical protein
MIRPVQPVPRVPPIDPTPLLPTFARSFDSVQKALGNLGLADPASLRSPRPVEEILAATAIPAGTLLILSPDEVAAAITDMEETVRDERAGGTVLVSFADRAEFDRRRRSLREIARASMVVCFAAPGVLPPSMGRLKRAILPESLRGWRFLIADTVGFRVALVGRNAPSGNPITLWTGNPELIAEASAPLRAAAAAAGIAVPGPASPVPVLEGIRTEADIWRQAAELRAYRVVREAELREIARAAALKGVALRREREEEAGRAAS